MKLDEKKLVLFASVLLITLLSVRIVNLVMMTPSEIAEVKLSKVLDSIYNVSKGTVERMPYPRVDRFSNKVANGLKHYFTEEFNETPNLYSITHDINKKLKFSNSSSKIINSAYIISSIDDEVIVIQFELELDFSAYDDTYKVNGVAVIENKKLDTKIKFLQITGNESDKLIK